MFGLDVEIEWSQVDDGPPISSLLGARKKVDVKRLADPGGRTEIAFFSLRDRISFSSAERRAGSAGTGVTR